MDLKKRQPIGVELVKRGIVTQSDIEKALEYQKAHSNVKLGDCLYLLELCNPQTLISAIGEILLNKGLVMETYITFESIIKNYLLSLEGNASDDIKDTSLTGTITNLVDSIIKTGIQKRASDIHIEPMVDEVRVRYRIDGELFTAAKIDKDKQNQIIRKTKSNI